MHPHVELLSGFCCNITRCDWWTLSGDSGLKNRQFRNSCCTGEFWGWFSKKEKGGWQSAWGKLFQTDGPGWKNDFSPLFVFTQGVRKETGMATGCVIVWLECRALNKPKRHYTASQFCWHGCVNTKTDQCWTTPAQVQSWHVTLREIRSHPTNGIVQTLFWPLSPLVLALLNHLYEWVPLKTDSWPSERNLWCRKNDKEKQSLTLTGINSNSSTTAWPKHIQSLQDTGHHNIAQPLHYILCG